MTSSRFEIKQRGGAPGSKPGSKIVKTVWIRASAQTVYRALTDSKELMHWFCDRASLDAREGGEFVALWKSGKTGQKGQAVITRIVPGSSLEILWTDDGRGVQDKIRHTLVYEIRSKRGLTELVMTDADDSASDEEATAALDHGWNLVLTELRDYCERRERSAKTRPHLRSGPQNAPAE